MADLAGKRVLVVDDEPLVGLAIEDTLVAAGAQVLGPASSVAQALALLADTRPDCVSLDWQLGGESSAPIALALALRGIPFLFLSGSQLAEIRSFFPGAVVLAKPQALVGLPAALAGLLPSTD